MATSVEYIDFVRERLDRFGSVRTRKMFGEYMVYFNDRPILTVCDNTVFVKKFPELSEIMSSAPCGFPYEGAKESYILDIENDELLDQVIPILGNIVPLPKSKKKECGVLMKSRCNTARKFLIFWTLFIGIGAVGGSTMMLADTSGRLMGMDAMLPYFQKLPFAEYVFRDFLFSGIALLIVNGITNLTAAVLLFMKKKSGILLGGIFGVTLML